MLRCGYCGALISEFAMNDLVDRILNTYQLMRPLDADRLSDSRQKITRYIEILASAGQSDGISIVKILDRTFAVILRCPVPVTTNRRLRSSAVLSMTVVKPIQKMIQ